MKPYKVVTDKSGIANVADRATGETVGWVVRWTDGWRAYRSDMTRVDVPHANRRADAVDWLWNDHWQATR